MVVLQGSKIAVASTSRKQHFSASDRRRRSSLQSRLSVSAMQCKFFCWSCRRLLLMSPRAPSGCTPFAWFTFTLRLKLFIVKLVETQYGESVRGIVCVRYVVRSLRTDLTGDCIVRVCCHRRHIRSDKFNSAERDPRCQRMHIPDSVLGINHRIQYLLRCDTDGAAVYGKHPYRC